MDIKLHELPSRVILGPCKSLSDNAIRDVLVAVVKCTFAADDPSTTPAEHQEPVYDQDVFFNIVRNSSFDSGAQEKGDGTLITPVAAWRTEGPTISHNEAARVLRVEGAGRVVQPLTFGRPLGGRTYWLRFQGRSDANATVSGIQVESKSGVVRFVASHTITPGFATFTLPAASWPASLEDNEATMVLAGSAATGIEYDQVQLSEGQDPFLFDEHDPIRYEHDLVLYKPRTDIVVLGQAKPPRPGPRDGTWIESVKLGAREMKGDFDGTGLTHLNDVLVGALGFADPFPPWSSTTPVTFGWQNRGVDPRYAKAGTYGADTVTLPTDFDNTFFNGGLYTDPDGPVFDQHPPAGAKVVIRTEAEYDNGAGGTILEASEVTLHLPESGPQAAVTYRTSPAPDAPVVSKPLDMTMDTIVYDKDTGHFYVVWRGVWWEYTTVPTDQLLSLVLS